MSLETFIVTLNELPKTENKIEEKIEKEKLEKANKKIEEKIKKAKAE